MSLVFSSEMASPSAYLPRPPAERAGASPFSSDEGSGDPAELSAKVDAVLRFTASRGFVFEPWQVATFVAAVRTKPFIILAGVSGTGKTKLPGLVADATGAALTLVPVRPDWTDSSDLLGFETIQGEFRPGSLLRVAKRAMEQPDKQFFFLLDEMNLARVEYYLAEVLSLIEERQKDEAGRLVSPPLVPAAANDGERWDEVRLPGNLCVVGSVNMDETTHGFSRRVLDRAFVIELSQVDLAAVGALSEPPEIAPWSSAVWAPPALSLADHPGRNSQSVRQIIETLITVNRILECGQLQFGYRVRDEVSMFCLAALDSPESFITASAGTVDPLDIAIAMKILPRIQGSGATVRTILEELLAWAAQRDEAETSHSGFPFCADRLRLMLRRLNESGFASYWL